MHAATAIRAGALAGVTSVLVLAAPLAANAHISVAPEQAAAGSYTQLSLAVANESEEASTTSVRIQLPVDTPFSSARLQPVAGWEGVVTTKTLPEPVEVDGVVVREVPVAVTWTAEPGTGLAPGQFQNFIISVGPVPDTGRILLPATQTYSDGEVVEWNQPTRDGGEEPESPAPVLFINDDPPVDDHSSADTTASAGGVGISGSIGAVLGAAGLGLGLVALVTAVLALTRSRRRTS